MNFEQTMNKFGFQEYKTSSISISRFKLEIWQILTLMTVIFSLSSVVFYFSLKTPYQVHNEFLLMDKTKSKIYNLYTKANALPKNITHQSSFFTSKDTGHSEILSLNSTDSYLELERDQLIEISNSYKNIVTNVNSLESIASNSKYIAYYNSLARVLQNTDSYYKNTVLYHNTTLEIKKDIYRVSSLSPLTDKSHLTYNIDNNIKVITSLTNDNVFSELVQNWKVDINNKQHSIESISKAKDNYNKIFQSPINYKSYDLEKSKVKFVNSLNKLQNWELEYIENNYRLQTRVVMIDSSLT